MLGVGLLWLVEIFSLQFLRSELYSHCGGKLELIWMFSMGIRLGGGSFGVASAFIISLLDARK